MINDVRIKCACGNPDCKVTLLVGESGERMWVTGGDGEITVVYLNPDSLQILTKHLLKIIRILNG